MKGLRLELRLDTEQRAKLGALAELSGKPASWVIRRLIVSGYQDALGAESSPVRSERAARDTIEVEVPSVSGPTESTHVEYLSDDLVAFHVGLLGREPTGAHRTLYAPGPKRAFLGRHLDHEQLEAIVVVAFYVAERVPVYLIAPKVCETELVATIKGVIRNAVTAAGTGGARACGDRMKGLAQRVCLWTRMPPEVEPPNWVAAGFELSDPTPAWLQRGPPTPGALMQSGMGSASPRGHRPSWRLHRDRLRF